MPLKPYLAVVPSPESFSSCLYPPWDREASLPHSVITVMFFRCPWTGSLRNQEPNVIFLKFFPWVTGHSYATVTCSCSETQLQVHSLSALTYPSLLQNIRLLPAGCHCTRVLRLDRVRPTPYEKGLTHSYFLKSSSFLNEIPLHLPHAWCKAKLVLKKIDMGEKS